jgi:hypothetical protein
MQKLILVLAAVMLVLGTQAFQADAQTQLRGAGAIRVLKNATPFPFILKAACNGNGGACCGPGYVDRCFKRTGTCCECVPC